MKSPTNEPDSGPSRSESPESSGFRLKTEAAPECGDADWIAESKFSLPSRHSNSSQERDLPRSYGSNSVVLMAKDPTRLFAYWDLDIALHPGGPSYLRCYRAGENTIDSEIEIPFEARNWYLPVTESNRAYFVEIGYYRNEQWQALGASEHVLAPPASLSEDTAVDFATLPLQLSYATLAKSLQSAPKNHPELMRRLAAVQAETGLLGTILLSDTDTNRKVLELLQNLLGEKLLKELLTSGVEPGPATIAALRQRLAESLSSESASGLLGRVLEASGSASLFSGFAFPGVLNSESVTSWSENLLSWSAAVRHIIAANWLSSWTGREQESSGLLAASQSVGAVGSSGAFASWIEQTLSSWQTAVLSSWNLAASGAWTSAPGEQSAFSGLFALPGGWSSASLHESIFGAIGSSENLSASSFTVGALPAQVSSLLFYSSWLESHAANWSSALLSSWGPEELASWTSGLLSSWISSESSSTSSPA